MSLERDLLATQTGINEKEFNYAGKHYSTTSFATAYSIDVNKANSVIEVLDSQGKIDWGTEEQIADKAVLKALEQVSIFESAQAIQEDIENEINFKKEQRRIGRHIYEKVSFDFGSTSSARDFQVSVSNLRLESEILPNDENNGYIVRVFNLSDKELNNLSNVYKANKAITATVEGTAKVFDNAVKATDYTAKKVLVPVTKIGLTGVLNIGKSLFGTVAKVGGITVSETVKVSRDTVTQIRDDESIAIAKAELCRTKNDIMATINKNRGGNGGNGINIG